MKATLIETYKTKGGHFTLKLFTTGIGYIIKEGRKVIYTLGQQKMNTGNIYVMIYDKKAKTYLSTFKKIAEFFDGVTDEFNKIEYDLSK